MVIRDIGRAEFVSHLSFHKDLKHFIGDEVEWFSNRAGNVIGTVALGDRRQGWNYVILKRNRDGAFQVRNVMGDFYNRAAARVAIVVAMKHALNAAS